MKIKWYSARNGITGFNEIKLYGKEEEAIDEFIAINGKLQAADLKLNLYQVLWDL